VAISKEFLKSTLYFSELTDPEIDAVSDFIIERSYGKGETITWEGDASNALYFVVSGAVKSFKTSEEGKEQIIEILLPGHSFNDVAVLDAGTSPTGTESMSSVTTYSITGQDLNRVLKEYPHILPNVIEVLTQKIRTLLELVEDLSFRHVINRIARVLLEYAGEGTGAKPKLTQQEMASIAGTAREVVGRSLKTLQEDGLIRMERNRLVIADKQALAQMAAAATG